MIGFSPPGFCASVRRRVIPRNRPSRPLLPRVLFKAMCFITVVVRPNNTSNEWQIHNCKISIFFHLFFLFLFFLLSQMPFMSTAQRFSLLNISLRNNTFCFWDQLVGGWPLFSPPGASIRHAGPGPEPKPGREPEPRRWHTDRRSDPLAGPRFCPGHRLPVQDTGQIEGHTEGERCVKVRHDSVARAAFLFWHLMRERRRRRGQEGGEAGQGQSWGDEEKTGVRKSEEEWEMTCIHGRPTLARTLSVWSTKCFDMWSVFQAPAA